MVPPPQGNHELPARPCGTDTFPSCAKRVRNAFIATFPVVDEVIEAALDGECAIVCDGQCAICEVGRDATEARFDGEA